MSNFSRLVIDPNRSKSDLDLIVENPFGVKIPEIKILNLKKNKIEYLTIIKVSFKASS